MERGKFTVCVSATMVVRLKVFVFFVFLLLRVWLISKQLRLESEISIEYHYMILGCQGHKN